MVASLNCFNPVSSSEINKSCVKRTAGPSSMNVTFEYVVMAVPLRYKICCLSLIALNFTVTVVVQLRL